MQMTIVFGEKMKAVILAAGKSTRTYPLTLTKPKPLLKIANKTILEHNLDQFMGLVDEVIIIVGYKKEMIKDFVGNYYNGLKVTFITQNEQMGNGHALMQAKELLNEKFIVINGDDLFFREDIENCIRHEYCIAVIKKEEMKNCGAVYVEGEKVIKLVEKEENPKTNLANIGLYIFGPKIFEHKLEKSSRGEYEITDFVGYLASKGIINYELAERWCPIVYPWSIIEANEYLLKMITNKIEGEVEPNATIKGKIHLGEGSIIKNGAYVEGNVVIGKNCVIGPNCYIRGYTAIGDNCKIGNAVEIKNSVLNNNVHVGHLSYIGDSVLGENVNIGAGTITANLRHDNSNVKSMICGKLIDTGRRKFGTIIMDNIKTGIKTTIYPGRKLLRNTMPAEVIKEECVG